MRVAPLNLRLEDRDLARAWEPSRADRLRWFLRRPRFGIGPVFAYGLTFAYLGWWIA